MKKCPYCGRQNPDDAVYCSECATQYPAESQPPPATPEPPRSREYLFAPLSPADRAKTWVNLLSCETLGEADVLVCQLEAAGIPAFIPDKRLMQNDGMPISFGYVRVQVSPYNYDAAKALLS